MIKNKRTKQMRRLMTFAKMKSKKITKMLTKNKRTLTSNAPKIGVVLFGGGLLASLELKPRARQQQNGHFASTE